MIISHEHRFVFIKTRKTGGSSVEALLRTVAGADAVVTPLRPAGPHIVDPDGRNWRGLFNPVPDLRRRWRATGPGLHVRDRGLLVPFIQLKRRLRYFEHMSLELIRERAGCSIEGYFTFCFERNPWDKALSWWLWSNRQRRDDVGLEDFEEWVLNPATKGWFSDWYMYTVGGEIAVDFVGRFESLETDLREALTRVGIDLHAFEMPHEKLTTRPASTPVSSAARERIASVFHREIDVFGYDIPAAFVR